MARGGSCHPRNKPCHPSCHPIFRQVGSSCYFFIVFHTFYIHLLRIQMPIGGGGSIILRQCGLRACCHLMPLLFVFFTPPQVNRTETRMYSSFALYIVSANCLQIIYRGRQGNILLQSVHSTSIRFLTGLGVRQRRRNKVFCCFENSLSGYVS